ncbi:pantetheine-phosphate adenylyltransferase [Trypanosoma conorhini]|uniref:Pantetheine-phosphate adenylyltransferase n=1 Tax=Trypanosoma conorhini TaxID=83891 RepID=A0A422QBI6_9TRYP|nr:pantetheine-phosphate adenylyltransferase [Trypanosoma conorhini]RNF27285.1 pantetheine-phosphate adenylyltransferase [Trypanosoma conorhini]
MRALRLSTMAGVESNKAALRAYLMSLRGAESVGDPKNPLSVQLRIHDGRRDTLLRHTKELYVASLEHHPGTFVNVIPIFPSGDEQTFSKCSENDRSAPLTLFSAASMTADRGFIPLYTYVALGGTFDHLHAGHKLLLTTALFYATTSLRVGITLEVMLARKQYGSYIESFEARRDAVTEFLHSVRTDIELRVVGITEPSGGTNRDAEVEALVVSPETAGAVASINTERASHGLKPLDCIQIPCVGTDGDDLISSTKLRRRLSEDKKDDTK